MLFENNEHIPLHKESTHPIAVDYNQKLAEIRKLKFPLRFKTVYGRKFNVTGEPEPDQGIVVLYEGDYVTDKGVKTKVRYSKDYPTRRPNGRFIYQEGSGDWITRQMLVEKDELDKAYYLLYVCPLVKKGIVFLENKEKEAQDFLTTRKTMAFVDFMLTDSASNLSSDEERVRQVAMAFGVSGASDKSVSLSEVKEALIKIIEMAEIHGDTSRGVAAFREYVTIPERSRKRALIQQAIDDKKLYFDVVRYEWMLVIAENDVRKIAGVTSNEMNRKEDVLVRTLNHNADARMLFELAMNEEGCWNDDKEFDPKDIDNLSWNELLEQCKKVSISVAQKKQEVLRNELKQHYGVA